MKSGRWYAAIALAGIAVAFLLPLSPALSSGDVRQARFIGAVCTALSAPPSGCRGADSPLHGRRFRSSLPSQGSCCWPAHITANTKCVATYDGRAVADRPRISPPPAANYVSQNPGVSASDLLLDAGGVAERIWTPASISSCRLWISGVACWPCPCSPSPCVPSSRAAVFGLRLRPHAAGDRVAHASQPVPAPVFDAFLSYRHTEPDTTRAKEILEVLESRGLRVAIDFRDFAPNQHFLAEMERCIKESRFVLCLVTSPYLDSDNCVEEAIISKTLDMADRRKRLVPLIFERVDSAGLASRARRHRFH